MSRYKFLIIVIILLFTGTVLFYQLHYATRLSGEMLIKETHIKLKREIADYYNSKKRYPDGDREIKTILSRICHPIKLKISGFSNGTPFRAAEFSIVFRTHFVEVKKKARYFGVEYINSAHLRGRLYLSK